MQLNEVNRFAASPGGKQLAHIIMDLRVGVITDETFDLLNNSFFGDSSNHIDMSDASWQ